LPVKAPPVVVATVYSWTGFYIGLNAGGAWGRNHVTYTPLYSGAPAGLPAFAAANGSPTLKPTGFTGGGQAGYNWQSSNWVFGIEADFNYARLSKSLNSGVLIFPGSSDFFFVTSTTSNWMATIRPRLGYALDRGLIYVTGGLAVADIKFAQSVEFLVGAIAAGSAHSTRAGWTVGGGVEYAFAPRWSAKAEYLHSDFGSVGFSPSVLTNTLINSTSRTTFKTDVARVGINYHFGGPVVARY
jgi:outer membrane immunogenic protein